VSAVLPFENLGPERILDALASCALIGDGRLLALNSYENRVYLVWLEDAASVVVKFYRPARWTDEQILEEHAFCAELAAEDLPVVAPLMLQGRTLHAFEGHRFAVFPRQGGRAPEIAERDVLARLGRLIGRIHAVGARKPFKHRPTLDIQSYLEQPRDQLLGSRLLPEGLRSSWRAAVEQALQGVREGFDRASGFGSIRLHADCHPGNMLWTDDGPHFVDLDDCRMGPAIQDLWMLLSGDPGAMAQQLQILLEGYASFAPFDRRELHLIEPLRTLRMIHYSAWLAARREDPAFAQAFPWFGSDAYWQERIQELREQVMAMQQPLLEVSVPLR
jgi:Ser/Thr protein kinase RdoA (MazF antagonist)